MALTTASPPDEILNTALMLPLGKGVLLKFPDQHSARRYRWKLYATRRRVRDASTRQFGPSDPLWDKSPWDNLQIQVLMLKGDEQIWAVWVGVRPEGIDLPQEIALSDNPKGAM